MVATTGADRADCRRTSRRADGAGVDDLATSDGEVDGEFLKPGGRKGQRIITEHHQVGQLSQLDAAKHLLLEARIGSVDGLAAQGFRHGERLTSRDLLAAERLVRYCGAEVT